MSTNDTLRGLLVEAKHYIQSSRFTNGLLARIDAALAEPVSGDKWAEYREKFCGCKDASRLNSCRGLPNCELRADHPERKTAALNGGAVAGQSELLASVKDLSDCLSKCLTGGEVTAKHAGRALLTAAELIDACTCKGGE